MSGVLVIGPGNLWTPAWWVFDNVLGAVAHRVRPVNQELADRLVAVTEGFQYFDASSLSAQDMRLLWGEVLRLKGEYQRAGDRNFQEPEAYPRFMRELEQLITRLEDDPRIERA